MKHTVECIVFFFLLIGCSDARDYSVTRPKVFHSEDYGIKIGQTTEDEIRNKYKVIASSAEILRLDPEDPHFKKLPIERAMVYIDENRKVSGFILIYKKRTISFLNECN